MKSMKNQKNIFSLAYGLLIGVFFFLFIMFAGIRMIGFQPYVVTSGSMIPIYQVGSIIYVRKVEPPEIKIGDAITFYMTEDRITATHQVYEIDWDKKLFYTQGVNNLDGEGNIIHDSEPVPFDAVIGKPMFSVPYLGYISQLCTSSPGRYIVVGFVITCCFILFVFEKITKQEEKEHE